MWDVKNTFEGVARPPCILPAKTTQTTFAFFPLRRPYSMLLWWWSSGLCPCLPGSNLSPGPPPVRGRQIALWILYKYIIKNKNTWPRCMGWVGCKCMKEKKMLRSHTYVYCWSTQKLCCLKHDKRTQDLKKWYQAPQTHCEHCLAVKPYMSPSLPTAVALLAISVKNALVLIFGLLTFKSYK